MLGLHHADISSLLTGSVSTPNLATSSYLKAGSSLNSAQAENFSAQPFGSSNLEGGYGLAADAGGAHLYVADNSRDVADVFSRVTVPTLSVQAPTELTPTSAALSGTLDPAGGGNVTSCQFEYVNDRDFQANGFENATKALCAPSAPYSVETPVSSNLTNLVPGARYYFRLTASNGVSNQSEVDTFTTPQAPGIETVYSAHVTETGADLIARIDPNGASTTYRFEYGPTTNYGSSAPEPAQTVSAASGGEIVEVQLTDLIPHVTYHFRVVAENIWGTTTSEDVSFNFFFPQPFPMKFSVTIRQLISS